MKNTVFCQQKYYWGHTDFLTFCHNVILAVLIANIYIIILILFYFTDRT